VNHEELLRWAFCYYFLRGYCKGKTEQVLLFFLKLEAYSVDGGGNNLGEGQVYIYMVLYLVV